MISGDDFRRNSHAGKQRLEPGQVHGRQEPSAVVVGSAGHRLDLILALAVKVVHA